MYLKSKPHEQILVQPSAAGRCWGQVGCVERVGAVVAGSVGADAGGFVVVQPGPSQGITIHCTSTTLIGG